MIDPRQLAQFVFSFPEDLKSRELVLQLLEHTPAPFSREQFQPGHVTCTGLVLIQRGTPLFWCITGG